MGFVFRAAFWLAVVAAFMPRAAHGEPGIVSAAPISTPRLDPGASLVRMCAEQPEVCAAGAEAASVTKALARFAFKRVNGREHTSDDASAR